MVKKVIAAGEEYEVMRQTSTAKKTACVFIALWVCLVSIPAAWWVWKRADSIKSYIVVRTIYETNKALMDGYGDLSGQVVSKLNISKYTSKISIPEIKLDKVSAGAEKINRTAGLLSKVGVSGAAKVADTSGALQKEVDKVNAQIRDATDKAAKALSSDIAKAIKDELDELAKTQMQRQLRLSDAGYKNLMAGRYGVLTAAGRKTTAAIYSEFSRNTIPVVKNVMGFINAYSVWILLGIAVAALLITLIPVAIAWKIAGFFSKNFTKCPYCGKVFLSKRAKLGLLGLVKFW